MKKKKKTKSRKPKTIPQTERDHLLTLIELTKRAMTSQNNGIDQFFEQQIVKLTKQIDLLK